MQALRIFHVRAQTTSLYGTAQPESVWFLQYLVVAPLKFFPKFGEVIAVACFKHLHHLLDAMFGILVAHFKNRSLLFCSNAIHFFLKLFTDMLGVSKNFIW
mmetsp:Transcript_29145/g.48510  ORF Transcript_29145/g.48510 Transcript_29145/m.48510 type:complete len:101 (+) Transcript_29145:158-460(+)